MRTAIAPGSKEWHEIRKEVIGGTDIGAIVEVNPWKTAMDVYCEKLGLTDPPAENEKMRLGKRLERVVADLYLEKMGMDSVNMCPGEFLRVEHFGGTPDFLISSPAGVWGLEIKTTGARNAADWGDEGTDQIPEVYLCQCHWYMMLTGMKRWDVAVLIGGQEFRTYIIQHDEALENNLRSQANDFWHNHVEPEIPPPLDGGKGSERYLKAVFPRDLKSNLDPSSPAIDLLAEQYDAALQTLRDAQEISDRLGNEIRSRIGEGSGIAGANWQATWKKAKDTTAIDWQAIATELLAPQELIAKHSSIKLGSRRFLFKTFGG